MCILSVYFNCISEKSRLESDEDEISFSLGMIKVSPYER